MTTYEIVHLLGVGGVTACLLWLGYGIGWLVTGCCGSDDDAPD